MVVEMRGSLIEGVERNRDISTTIRILGGAESGCKSEKYAHQGTDAQQRYEQVL
jgi:hypothetical protein